MDIHHLRKEYISKPLIEKEMHKNPIEQLKSWMHLAINEGIAEPNAMVLATSTAKGHPSTRYVLLKQIKDEGIVFFTNYDSRKGREIAEHPYVSATIYWKEIYSQISIQGKAEKIDEKESDYYFASRPRETQLGAWGSKQGEVLSSRSELSDAFDHYRKMYEDREVPRPPYWGGYIIHPDTFLFWRGRENRLHDRFLYTKNDEGKWKVERIAP